MTGKQEKRKLDLFLPGWAAADVTGRAAFTFTIFFIATGLF